VIKTQKRQKGISSQTAKGQFGKLVPCAYVLCHDDTAKTKGVSMTQRRINLRLLAGALPLGVGLIALFGLSRYAQSTQATLDKQSGKFAPCPDSPNCVSTQSSEEDLQHYIAPLRYAGSMAEAKAHILESVKSMPRTRIITDEPNYLHVEFRSRIFHFVDDVEFYFGDTNKLIHFRSAARLGYGDLGVNRKRMEEIRHRFYRS
jgi:uncharacterized protein (DUF1499 family)